MAKKNSSKTATKEALQAAEPRMQVFTGWQGMNIANAPDGWVPREDGDYKFNQDDLKPNFLMIQNNLITTDNMTLETRMPSFPICSPKDGYEFTGVACIIGKYIFAVHKSKLTDRESLWYTAAEQNYTTNWLQVNLYDSDEQNGAFFNTITEVGYYQNKLIVLAVKESDFNPPVYKIFTGDLHDHEYPYFNTVVSNRLRIPNPNEEAGDDGLILKVNAQGTSYAVPADSNVHVIHGPSLDPGIQGQIPHYINVLYNFYISYTNIFGSTTLGTGSDGGDYSVGIRMERSPEELTSKEYIKISGTVPASRMQKDVNGIDIWCSVNNATEKIFCGHVDIPEAQNTAYDWTYNWYGSLTDVTQWVNNQLSTPKENTTRGVDASYFSVHDSKIFFWGGLKSDRLYYGGVSEHELSIARSYGGGWVDIEPGAGYEIMGTAKWKTVQGASIVTVMCGNSNTNKVKRFNLVETSTTFTNEISSKSYMYEEVPNVVGCNSRWGYGVFGDGLYSVGRYGLMLTTMAMEYNSQMRAQSVSDAIKPLFTDNLGKNLDNVHMICIDDIVYIVLASPDLPEELDQIVLCYDLNLKAWYTFTYDSFDPDRPEYVIGHGEHILNMLAVDSQRCTEGIGLITKNEIRLYPLAGFNPNQVLWSSELQFNVLMETGELMSRQPKQDMHYIQQLEFRFDYYVGDCTIYIDGVDYYGRPFRITKQCSQEDMQRDWTEWIRIERYVESYRIRLEGKARFRLVSINAKAYTTSKRISLPYGYDAKAQHRRRPGDASMQNDHHEIKSYNDLRRALVT